MALKRVVHVTQQSVGTWATGCTLILIDEETRHDPYSLLDLIAVEEVGQVFLPFTVLQAIVEAACHRERFPECLRLLRELVLLDIAFSSQACLRMLHCYLD